MDRPKRAAASNAFKASQKEEENGDSNDELDLSEESDGDFSSASSDEWDPNKTAAVDETFEDSDAESEESAEESESAPDSPLKTAKSRKSLVATLRGSHVNKFKRDLAQQGSSNNLQEVLQRHQYQKKKSIFDDSQEQGREATPDFDCSGGLRLSEDDSSDSEKDPVPIVEKKKQTPALINTINQASGSKIVDLKAIHDNLQQMESAKTKLMNYKSTKEPAGGSQNIAELLARGEGGPSTSRAKSSSQSQKRVRNTQDDSDSDGGWEEVEEDEAANYKVPQHGVEIVLNNFNQDHGKKVVKPVDLEAQLKRKLNRKRKEHQVCLHKVNLCMWISHCNYINIRLNDSALMATALKLLPKNKNHCYPKDQTDLDYFEQITKWFKSTITLDNKKMYCDLKRRPPIMTSLALQIQRQSAICRRDYVLIFVTLLRAIGIQCRMVQSLICEPLMPPKSDLLSLAMKKPEDKPKGSSSGTGEGKSSSSSRSKSGKSKSSRSSKSKPSTSKSTSSSSSKPSSSKSSSKHASSSHSKSPEKPSSRTRSKMPTVPQLDGGDDLPSISKTRTVRKPLHSDADVAPKVAPKKRSAPPMAKDSPRQARSRSPAATKMTPRVRFSLDSPNRNSPSPSEKLFRSAKSSAKNPVSRVHGAEDVFSPLKTRAMRQSLPGTSKSCLKATSAAEPAKEKLEVFSPRRLRSVSRSSNDEAGGSGNSKATKKNEEAKSSKKAAPVKEKDTLQVFSPRRLRSTSQSSNEGAPKNGETSKKPNLKILQMAPERKRPATSSQEAVEPKKVKATSASAGVKAAPKSAGTKRSTENGAESAVEAPKKKSKPTLVPEDYEDDTDESAKLFRETTKKPKKAQPKAATDEIDRRVLSPDAVKETTTKSKGIDIWVEVYSEKDARWIAIDVMRGKVDCVKEIVKTATSPMVYVFACNNDRSLKDVSARYCTNLNTTVRKMRVEPEYLGTITDQFRGVKTARDLKEDDELNEILYAVPKPTSIAQFKNHPLYALKRHLLKYEAIYPAEPPILGYIREEAIYPRDCVFVLHTRETWLKEARVVKLNEQPYKMTTTLKWDNVNRKILKDVPQELFGMWQTKDYEPPVAENGMVPRNAYGNVELFKPSMLPIGTVHLQLPGLNKVCRKLGVDCSQAIIGFDSNGGWPYPVYDGFIVCAEFEEKVLDAWNREQEEQEKKEQEKYEKRVYGNWKKLIKGLLIRQRLKNKYNFEGDQY